jgi:hypothetical protein
MGLRSLTSAKTNPASRIIVKQIAKAGLIGFPSFSPNLNFIKAIKPCESPK